MQTIAVNLILDESGSMEIIKESTIQAVNAYIKKLKDDKKVRTLFTLTKFNSLIISTPYVLKPIEKVPFLNTETYAPNMNTPLYDAVVGTIEKIQQEIKEEQPVVVAIMTDGEENWSHKHNEKCLHDLIHTLTHTGNWTFLYMGANQDSWANAQRLGIARGNTMQWDSTNQGVSILGGVMGQSAMAYSAAVADSGMRNTANYFHQEEKEEKK